MRKMITVIAAMLLALSVMAMPAMADETKTLDQLEQELADAQEEVERLRGVVADLEGDLALAEKAVEDKVEEIADLNEDLTEAEAALATAIETRDGLLGTIDAMTNPQGDCVGNPTQRAACAAAKAALPGAQTAVTEAVAAVKLIEADIEEAEKDLVVLEAEVDRLEALLDGDDDNIGARQELADAIAAEEAAAEALRLYVPPTAEVHPGCKGIANAQTKVSKGNAPAALAAVAEKLKCTA